MTAAPPVVPAVVRADVRHRRRHPFDYAFAHRTTMWLVDVADPQAAFPRWLRPLASIRARDHFDPADPRPLPEKVRAELAAKRLPWTADRVLMLANARSLGYVFDPLSTFFCLDADGRLEGVLAEVHNTYGGRHVYALPVAADLSEATVARTTPRSDNSVAKEFYVSPFFAVEGRYDIRTRLDADAVSVAIRLTQGDGVVFSASVVGALTPADRRTALRAVAGNPVPSQRVSALIRWHGVRLWLRRLPVVPRPRPQALPRSQAPKGIAR